MTIVNPTAFVHVGEIAIAHGMAHVVLMQEFMQRLILGNKIVDHMKKGGKGKHNFNLTAQDIISVTVSIAMVLLYTKCLFDLRGDGQSRVYGYSLAGELGVLLHQGYTLYETILYVILGKDKLMFLHHFAVLLNGYGLAQTKLLQYYYSWFGLIEGTNPSLSALYAVKRFGMGSTATTLSGASLFLSFFILRIILLPVGIYYCFSDAHFVNGNDQYHYQLGRWTNVLVFLLSCYWFYKIAKGMLKQLSPKKPEKKEE